MKKHVLGLTLFSFIVGATAFVYGIFFAVSPVVPVAVEMPVAVSTYPATSCWKMKRDSSDVSLKVNQAVFNLQSKEFSWEIATPRKNAMIALHFFSKDGTGTRYINTETVNAWMAQGGVLRFNNTYQWMRKLKSLENLYVTAEFETGSAQTPKFDAANATAVTLDHGKLDYPIVGDVEVR